MEPVAAPAAAARPQALQAATMCEAFQATAADYAELPALRLKDSDYECRWSDFADTVKRRAAGFAALGVRSGDTVGFMLVNRPALHLCDCAAMHLGATCFSIYNTSSPEQIEYLLTDAGNRVVVTEQGFLERILEVRERVPSLEHVVVADGDAPEGTISLEELETGGDDGFDFEGAWRAVGPDDVLCLIYTSGTTGPPKGVQLTHANMMSEWRALDQLYPSTPCGRTISFLPTAHVADRWAQLYGSMVYGHCVHCCPNPGEMVAYSIGVKPTVWGGVPRIWEKLKSALEANFQEEQHDAMEVGLRRARAKQEGEVPEDVEAEWRNADDQVFSKIREMLGLDQVEWFAVGAAPTPPEVVLFFDAMGIEIAELWGLSETCAVATINPPGAVRIGTVGKPLPGIEVELADDGEIKVRGPIVMKGYRNQPPLAGVSPPGTPRAVTAEAFGADGWFLTGDIGELDADGYLKIVDRKKELIINAAGKNMSPANIEAKIKAADGIVTQAVAIGDRRPYNVALIALDPEVQADDPEARVAAAVETANAQLSRVEQIKRFHIVSGEWQPGGDELTPTMKLKRKPIAEKYAKEIEALYAS